MSPTEPTYGSATQLLHSLDDSAVSTRMRVLALHARDHAGTPHLTGILRQLETAGHGRLAVHMAIASRDTNTVARHLAGPDHALRRAALCAIRESWLPDEAVPPALNDAPTGLRRTLYRFLYHSRRTTLADSLLSRVRTERGDAEAAFLLPACSPERVAEHLPGLGHAVRSWRRLARRHPEALLDLVREAHAQGGQPSAAFPAWRRVLQAVDPVRSTEVAALLTELGTGTLSRWGLNRLVPHAARLLYRDGDRHNYPFRHPALPSGERRARLLVRIIRNRPPVARRVLRTMSPSMRTGYLDQAAEGGSDGKRGRILLPYLDLLPRERAEVEARRALEHITAFHGSSNRYEDPNRDLDALAHLPHAEVVEELEDAATAGDTDRRARGLARLVEATARTGDPRLLARVLTERAERSRAERDPVRRSLLAALASVAPPLLAEASLPALHHLLAEALQSRDTSAPTRRALRDLAARMLRHPRTRQNPDAVAWALEVYGGLVTRFGAEGLREGGRPRARHPWWSGPRWDVFDLEPTLDQVLPPGLEHELHSGLAPVLDAARTRGDFAPVVALARELGRRAQGIPQIRERLAAAVGALTTGGGTDTAAIRTAEEAAELYLTGPNARADALALFDADPAAARVPRVWDFLARHHTPSALRSALDAAGEHRAAEGRAWVPSIDRRTARDWPRELRSRFADHLTAVADDPGLPPDDREGALYALGHLPDTTDRLIPHLKGADPVPREAAMDALGHGDEPDRDLELVLAHADGPQSRAAGPAMSRCAGAVAPSRLAPLLARALDGPAKVTVRKAAARLLAYHRPPGAIAHLARVLDTGGELHRDVRAAVVGALMRALDHTAALPVLVRHVHGFTDVEVQIALLAVSPLACPPLRRKEAARMVASLPKPSRDHGRLLGWTSRWVPWIDHDLDEVAEAVCDLERDAGRPVRVFEELLRVGRGTDRIGGMLSRLLAAVPGPEHGVPPGGPRGEHDSAHQRVREVLQLLYRRMDASGEGDPLLCEQLYTALDLLGTRVEYHPEVLALLRRMIAVETGRSGKEPSASRLATLLLLGARFLSRLPTARKETEALLWGVVGSGFRRGVALRTLEEVVCRLFEVAADTEGETGATMALLGLRIVERVGAETDWSDPWPGLLSRAGDLGHPVVRVEAWRLAVE